MKTFSQAPTETNELADIVDVLNQLPDNSTKLISPRDVRDAVYTLWQNTMFKPTSVSASAITYIGIDQYQLKDDSNTDWYPKVYFGKKQTGGRAIMNQDILNQDDADFFFYNTKNSQVLGNYDTSIAILSGTGSFYYSGQLKAPQIKSVPVSNADGFYMDLNILNTSYNFTDGGFGLTSYGGNINITSEGGIVSVNRIKFPKQNIYTPQNLTNWDGYFLSLEKGADNEPYAVWRSPFSQSVADIVSQNDFSITAPLITLDGYDFIDQTIVATAVGGVKAGESFPNGIDVLDLLRKIIYTYVAPRVTSLLASVSNPNQRVSLIETGDSTTYTSLRLYGNVVKNSTYSIPTPPGYLSGVGAQVVSTEPANNFTAITVDGEYNATYRPQETFDFAAPNNYKILTFTLSVTDAYPTTRQAGSTLKSVLPYFYGAATYSATMSSTFNGIPTADKDNIMKILGINESAPAGKLKSYITEPIIGNPTYSNNQYLRFTTRGLPGTTGDGKGYIYFGYPAGYPLLKRITDPNSQDITAAFNTYSIPSITHQGIINGAGFNYWNNRDYIFYISNQEVRAESGLGTYSFIFAE